MTTVTRKTVAKQQDELAKLLAQKVELEARIGPLWEALRMSRLIVIRADDDPGRLPQLSASTRCSELARSKGKRRNARTIESTCRPSTRLGFAT